MVGVDASESNINIARLHASRDPVLPYSLPPLKLASSSSWFSRQRLSRDTGSTAGSSAGSAAGSLEYRHTSAEALRDGGEAFDLVCAMEVLEHVDEPGEFLRCLGEMVKVRLVSIFQSHAHLLDAYRSILGILTSSFDILVFFPARRSSHRLHHLAYTSFATSHSDRSRVLAPTRHARHTHFRKIRQAHRASPVCLRSDGRV